MRQIKTLPKHYDYLDLEELGDGVWDLDGDGVGALDEDGDGVGALDGDGVGALDEDGEAGSGESEVEGG